MLCQGHCQGLLYSARSPKAWHYGAVTEYSMSKLWSVTTATQFSIQLSVLYVQAVVSDHSFTI